MMKVMLHTWSKNRGVFFKDTQRCPKIRVELLRVKVIYLKGYLSPHQGHEKLTQTAKWNFSPKFFNETEITGAQHPFD